MPIYKKGWKEDLGNYRSVSLTSMPEKVIKRIILSAIVWHMQDNQLIRHSQHGFMKGRGNDLNLAAPKEHFENSRRKNTSKIPEISHKYEEFAEGKPALKFHGTPSAKTT
ncbi:rna-directed dna polymerase from mobile element jockey-like [Willisornis vidua]|uniref:Rna-directed dna polymerase from mobile element jockey-like n=1 Tax=Willisornis vidua TaxID=1566151 RepID=A0ABQ9DHW1_9PASS|nr:rna-directed dna polymerase from mobile element jockey-like [Willisornis vidua]